MNWFLMLAILGIVVVAAYYLNGGKLPGMAAKVTSDNPGSPNTKPWTASGLPVVNGGHTGYSPPPRVKGTGNTLVTPSTGPVSATRSGSGHF